MVDISNDVPRRMPAVNGYQWFRIASDPEEAARVAVELVFGDRPLINLSVRQALALQGVTPSRFRKEYRIRRARKNGGG
jgi:hypothetical protein